MTALPPIDEKVNAVLDNMTMREALLLARRNINDATFTAPNGARFLLSEAIDAALENDRPTYSQ